jgi:hypothetical protein
MLRILVVAFLCVLTAAVSADQYVAHATLPYRGPVAYSDKKLQRVFYVESDGQHLSCIGFDGKVMWTRVPFVDARLEPYRMEKPRIVFIGQPLPWMLKDRKGTFVAINFESTQFGVIDIDSGTFYFWGQD